MTPPGLRSEVQITVDGALSTPLLINLEIYIQHETVALWEAKRAPSFVKCVSHEDSLVSLYTGFLSHGVLLSFYKFLGQAVNTLTYWGVEGKTLARRHMKLDSFNQVFLTLIKLKLDLNVGDLAFYFQISSTTLPGYFITWVCFMYNELKASCRNASSFIQAEVSK